MFQEKMAGGSNDPDDLIVRAFKAYEVEGMKRGMTLIFSMWDDHAAHMLWLDSNYPPEGDPSKPGVARGPCPTSSGVPSEVEEQQADATVTWSNIGYGPIGSTFKMKL